MPQIVVMMQDNHVARPRDKLIWLKLSG